LQPLLDLIDPGQIVHQSIGSPRFQLVTARRTSGDGEDFGSECPRTGDIPKRVADYDDVLCGKVLAEDFHRAAAGDGTEFVAVVVIVAIGSGGGGKMTIQPEVTQFDCGTLPQVSGEEAETISSMP